MTAIYVGNQRYELDTIQAMRVLDNLLYQGLAEYGSRVIFDFEKPEDKFIRFAEFQAAYRADVFDGLSLQLRTHIRHEHKKLYCLSDETSVCEHCGASNVYMTIGGDEKYHAYCFTCGYSWPDIIISK